MVRDEHTAGNEYAIAYADVFGCGYVYVIVDLYVVTDHYFYRISERVKAQPRPAGEAWMETPASSAWVRQSMPVSAVRFFGIDITN